MFFFSQMRLKSSTTPTDWPSMKGTQPFCSAKPMPTLWPQTSSPGPGRTLTWAAPRPEPRATHLTCPLATCPGKIVAFSSVLQTTGLALLIPRVPNWWSDVRVSVCVHASLCVLLLLYTCFHVCFICLLICVYLLYTCFHVCVYPCYPIPVFMSVCILVCVYLCTNVLLY